MVPPAQMPRDSLVLRGLVFYGYHGVLAEEQKLGQRFQVDLRLWMDLQTAARSDDLADTVSYAAVFDQVRAILEGPPSRLLEHVAGRLGAALFALDPRIARVRVRLLKLDPPIAAMNTGQAGVVLYFSRE